MNSLSSISSSSSRKPLVYLLNRLSVQSSQAGAPGIAISCARRWERDNLRTPSCGCPKTLIRHASTYRNSSGDGGSWKYRGGSRRYKSHDIGESTILVQEGTNIQEVPLAVLKSNNVGEPAESKTHNDRLPMPYANLNPREEEAFIEGFNKFNSPKEILRILNTIPSSEVTPKVALCIVRKLFELENNFSFRNNGQSWLTSASEENNVESFGRMAIVSRLMDTIILSENNQILLETLNVLGLESNNASALKYYFESHEEFLNYRMKLCNEALVRTIEGRLSVEDICYAICSIGQIGTGTSSSSHNSKSVLRDMQTKFIDKMWVGIVEKRHEVTSENISQVFNTIQYLSKSRRLVMNLVEKKLITIWWNLRLNQIADICKIITTEAETKHQAREPDKVHDTWNISSRVLMAFSRNLSLNLHKVTEDELGQIVKAFHVLNFIDPTIEKTLGRYMKARCLKIADPTLVTVIMNYVAKFKLRSCDILSGVSEYVNTHDDLSPVQLISILIPFGEMGFQPENGVKFWQNVEKIISEKFVQFSPRDIIDMFLSCVYLQKFPLNFKSQIFSPYFLDRLHSSESDFHLLQQTRTRLKLLDSALTLECGHKYNGPLLPKDFSAKSMSVDVRILKFANVVESCLKSLFKNSTCITETAVKIPNMPLNEMYIIDLFINQIDISPSTEQEVDVLEEMNLHRPSDVLRSRFNPRYDDVVLPSKSSGSKKDAQNQEQELIAVLIHLPEHYCTGGNDLIGPQLMRIRHLKLLGCTVMSLSMDKLALLRNQSQALIEYLQESLKNTTPKL